MAAGILRRRPGAPQSGGLDSLPAVGGGDQRARIPRRQRRHLGDAADQRLRPQHGRRAVFSDLRRRREDRHDAQRPSADRPRWRARRLRRHGRRQPALYEVHLRPHDGVSLRAHDRDDAHDRRRRIAPLPLPGARPIGRRRGLAALLDGAARRARREARAADARAQAPPERDHQERSARRLVRIRGDRPRPCARRRGTRVGALRVGLLPLGLPFPLLGEGHRRRARSERRAAQTRSLSERRRLLRAERPAAAARAQHRARELGERQAGRRMNAKSVPAILAFSMLAAGAAWSADSAAKIRIAFPSLAFSYMPFYVAQEKGLLKKAGLEAEYIQMRTGIMPQAVINGNIDFFTSPSTGISPAVTGLPLVIALNLYNGSPWILVTGKEIAKPHDLVGKSVAISGIRNSPHYYLLAALKKWEIPEKDVSLISTGGTESSFAALTSHQVAGTVLTPPFDDKAVTLGFKKFQFLGDLADVPYVGLVTSQAEMKTRRELVQKTIAVLLEGAAWVRANRDESVQIGRASCRE